MASRSNKGIDWSIILIVLVIMAFGVANIYSVDADYGIKQVVRIGLGFVMIMAFLVISSIARNFFDIYAFVFYLLGVLSLVGVLFFGKEINGAKAWYSIGGVGIQPVELMKIATGLMIAHVVNIPGNTLDKKNVLFTCLALIGIPGILILLQPDVGSLFVFVAFLLAMYREGMHPGILFIPIIFGLVFLGSILLNPISLMLVLGIIVWFLSTLFLLLFSKSTLSYQGLYGAIGFFCGLGTYFIFLMFFFEFFWKDYGLTELFMSRKSIFYSITSFGMGLISLITALCIYLSFGNNHKTISKFTKIKAANTRYFLTSWLSISVSFIILFGISFYAEPILNKLPIHQRERILVLFEGESKYRDTSGYNLLYSKTAIGSGELWGAGWNKGTVTDGRFVPEQWTDYIFCTVGEEWGFVGSSILVILYAILIGRIFYLAEVQKTIFARFFGYTVGSIILLHFFINIGMVMGLFPTVGIPLPFLSYGGSSLWGFMLMLFIFLRLNYDNEQSFL
ncbi:cell cycle protein [Flavobacteriaceae bacterium Ap0902]|nr:cell cycle protein [Flavobacteriaceae bacterium Ap0902]